MRIKKDVLSTLKVQKFYTMELSDFHPYKSRQTACLPQLCFRDVSRNRNNLFGGLGLGLGLWLGLFL